MSKMNFNFPRKQSKAQGCLIIFGLPFFAAGCFMLWTLFFQPFKKSIDSNSWVETPCVITKSQLKTNTDSDGTSYRPDISYTYEYEGEKYESKLVDFSGNISSNDRVGEMESVEAYPTGSTRKCYVNPDNPAEAVLVRDWGRGLFKWVVLPFGGVFALVGLGLMIFGASPWLFKNRKHANRGAVTLTPSGQRLRNLGGILFINIFWNGIISVFVIFWLAGLIRGKNTGFMFTWGLGLFLLPFVAIGTFMFLNLVKEIKKLFAPKISISLKQGTRWSCGSTVNISWSIPYSSMVDKLNLDFICREAATYTRGTNSVTDEEIVAAIPITESKSINFTGSCKFKVPANLMPSFQSRNNVIEWGLRVRTEGPGPDAEDIYIIELIRSSS